MDERKIPHERTDDERRENEERQQIINLPSAFVEMLNLAGINIRSEKTQETVVRWIRASYEDFLWREKRSLMWSGVALWLTAAIATSVITLTVSNLGSIARWLHGFLTP